MTDTKQVVTLEKHRSVGMLTIDYPPVNAIGLKVRKGLVEGISKTSEDPDIKAIVIICKGKTFFAGADISEFDQPEEASPKLDDVINTIENSPVPVIAAIHGTALGGGMEIALACDYRVAVSSAKIGLPEVHLGLIPGGGGTQRLPRLVGSQKALDMICTGKPIGADKALSQGIIDKEITEALAKGAMAFAEAVILQNLGKRKVSQMDEKIKPDQFEASLFDFYRETMAKKARGFEAPQACIQAVEAAVQNSFEQGIQIEKELFQKLVKGSQSTAQQYYFFAERQVAKIPGITKDTPKLEIQSAGVIGAGTMGGGIAMNFINQSIPVTLVETKQEYLDRGLAAIRKNYDISAAKGKLSPSDVENRMALIAGTLNLEDLTDSDIVVEAVFENMDLKKEIFKQLDQICKPDAILATNTSYLDVDEIAAQTSRPESVLGYHFFSPANVMRLLEIVKGEKTSKTVLATSIALAKNLGKIPVLVGVCFGFAANRMFEPRSVQAELLLQEGALPAQVDQVIYNFGFPMGHFDLNDLIGNDVGWDKETSKGQTIHELVCEKGWYGIKTGVGYYKYSSGSRFPNSHPEVETMITEFSTKKGITRRSISDDEIKRRCIYPIINEGAKILEEKIAVRPSDLDVIWVNGFGWPVYLGGPMFYADMIGLDKILETLKAFQGKYGEFWKPAPLLEKLVQENKTFNDLNV